MSRASEYNYELEQALRQQIYNARVSETTERFYQRYMSQYEQMRRDGYAAYIPGEMSRLEADLSRIRQLLVTNPLEAREISRSVGSYIWQIGRLARAAVEQFDRAERMRQEVLREQARAKQNALLTEYYRQVGEIAPAVVHFAQSDLQKIRTALETGKMDSVEKLRKDMSSVLDAAKERAVQWKQATGKSNKKQAVLSRLDEVESLISKEKIEDRERASELIERVRSLRECLHAETLDASDVDKELSQVENGVDDLVVAEEVRRQAVVAFIKLLRGQEFTVSSPVLVRNGSENYVKITAQRPSGNHVVCQFDLRGKVKYKFEHYEGMACLKDIEKVKVDLDRIYSIKLSDERVLWENPDRLSKDADRIPSGTENRGQR